MLTQKQVCVSPVVWVDAKAGGSRTPSELTRNIAIIHLPTAESSIDSFNPSFGAEISTLQNNELLFSQ